MYILCKFYKDNVEHSAPMQVRKRDWSICALSMSGFIARKSGWIVPEN